MQHLLICISTDVNGRKRRLRKATPTVSSTSNSSTSSAANRGRKRSRESSPSGGDSGSMSCDQDSDNSALIRTAHLLFDYLMKVSIPVTDQNGVGMHPVEFESRLLQVENIPVSHVVLHGQFLHMREQW